MLPLLRRAFWALLFDENAAKRQIRGIVGVLAASGAAYAEQLSTLVGGAPHLAQSIKVASVLCAFAVAAHGDPVTK